MHVKWAQGLPGLLMLALVSAPAPAEELVVYSGRSDKFVRPVAEAFEHESGIDVVLHSAKSTELLNKLRLEGARTPADLYISNDAGNLQIGSELGLFRPVPAEVAERIPANFRARDDTWIGLSGRARVLVVNTRAEGVGFIASVFDLADPRLAGRLGLTHSANASFIAGITVYMEEAGTERVREWLEGLKANVDGRVYSHHSSIVGDVAAGRKAVGLVNHYYIYRHLDERPDAPIDILLPDQGEDGMGVAWNTAGIAISRHTDHPEAAEAFVEFLTSEEGQYIFAEVNREYPTRADVPAAPQVPPRESYEVADVPMAELGRRRDATLDLIERVGMP
ncbi:MAG: extracellular solute-binding protein [Gammaproteobacteria bacterium]|nr:extracellular solute-binding protein [Gammaproteobacteria bacterium]